MVDGVYHFYCVNDFHGSILERQSRYYEAGIAKYFGKLREFKEADPEHTFILSAGDMYQGSLESNSNYGELVTKCMNDIPFDSMTVGNHEFDYGPDRLKANVDLAEFPVLAGNIMKWENGAATTTPWYEGIGLSTVIERGGNTIGIVGMIGKGQTTSISSQYIQDCDFVDPDTLAKNEAKRLREEGCDIVILVGHDTYRNLTFAANKDYFDGIFAAHTHTGEVYCDNGVPAVQSYCNGEAISHFDLTVAEGEVTCSKYEIISANSNWVEDESIAAIRDAYLDEDFKAMSERVAGTVTGTLTAKKGIPNLICKAMYEKYAPDYPDLVCAMCNGQRANVSGTATYSDIYKATPFTNCIIIANVRGENILHEGGYNNTYTGDPDRYSILDPNAIYQIACIDYIAFHQNEQKVYDYFPSLNSGEGGEAIATYHTYPFDLAFDYCVKDLAGVINANDFSNTSPGFGLYA